MSNLGRVRSWIKGSRAGTIRRVSPYVLTGRPNHRGHLRVLLDEKNYLVHRLVLLAFVGEPPADKPLGLHENDIADDNRLSNLRWGTSAENRADSRRNGTEHRPRGELSARAKLTWDLVREIRASSETSTALALRLGISISAISKARRGETWKGAA